MGFLDLQALRVSQPKKIARPITNARINKLTAIYPLL
jgi:hypothetical protein